MARRKKTFDCGHVGFGGFCHRCAQKDRERGQRREKRQQRKELGRRIPVKIAHLPLPVQERAVEIHEAIASGAHWGDFGGKMIQNRGGRNLISIPLPSAYRMVYERAQTGVILKDVMSHEEYNHLFG